MSVSLSAVVSLGLAALRYNSDFTAGPVSPSRPSVRQTPVQWRLGITVDEPGDPSNADSAVTRKSLPACFWRSPMAISRARRAFARAVTTLEPELALRSEIVLSESKPTAITVSRIIRDKVTIREKPREPLKWLFPGFASIFVRLTM